MDFPDFFPSSCPPIDAKPATGEFYRVVKVKPDEVIPSNEFRSQRENQRKRIWPPENCECDLCAISLMNNIQDALKLKMTLIGKIPANSSSIIRVARGTLHPEMGKIKHDPDYLNGYTSHHNLWACVSANLVSAFTFVESAVENGQ